MHSRSRMTIWYRLSHSHNVGTQHVEFSPIRQTSRAPRAGDGRGGGAGARRGIAEGEGGVLSTPRRTVRCRPPTALKLTVKPSCFFVEIEWSEARAGGGGGGLDILHFVFLSYKYVF